MSEERRSYLRRRTNAAVAIETTSGESLDEDARVLNLSIAGARIATSKDLDVGQSYRLKLAQTDAWIDISVKERVDGEYRCVIETSWDDLQDVIRQSDDLTLLVLESSEPDDTER